MEKEFLIAAHRGVAGGNVPCNTLIAFKSAVFQGADIIELDVLKSTDGEMFVFHDGNQYPHLGIKESLTEMSSNEIRKIKYINCDRNPTEYGILSLAEALDYLKGKALIAIDKAWNNTQEIVEVVKNLKAENDVMLKIRGDYIEFIDKVAQFASDVPILPIIWDDNLHMDYLRNGKMNIYGFEPIIRSENSIFLSEEFVRTAKLNNEKLWANPIVYSYKDILSAGHTDDIAVSGNPDYGWGYLVDKGYNILQTDWTMAMYNYRQTRVQNN